MRLRKQTVFILQFFFKHFNLTTPLQERIRVKAKNESGRHELKPGVCVIAMKVTTESMSLERLTAKTPVST